jgi:VanZ family protein
MTRTSPAASVSWAACPHLPRKAGSISEDAQGCHSSPRWQPFFFVLFRRHVTGWFFTGGRGGVSKGRIKLVIKLCSVAAVIAAIVFAQLGPADWQLRPNLGWRNEHIIAYFVVTSIVCLAWPRPFVVGPALMAASPLLEALQALTPDRHANFEAGLYGAGGALAAASLAELFIRAWRWRTPLKTVKIAGGLTVVAFAVLSLVPRELRPHTGFAPPLEHISAYAIGAGLLTLGYYKRNRPLFVVLSLSLYAAILEIAQIWVPGRNPTVIDFAASSAGALIGSALAWIGLQATPSTRKKWGMLLAKTEGEKI